MRVAHLWHRRCYDKIAILSGEYHIMKTKLLTVLLLSTTLAISACSGGGNASSSESSSSSSSSSHVVITYQINYFLNGGVNNAKNASYYKSNNPSIPLHPASKDGYSFIGWYTTATFKEGTLLTSIPANSTGDITLYAKWNDGNEYKVSLDPTGGIVSPNEVTVKYNERYNIPSPLRDGYTFKNWVDENSQAFPGTGTWNIAGDKVLSATWDINQYTITYNLNGGTNNPANPINYNYENEDIVFADASKTGYTFLGWYKTSSFDEDSKISSIPTHSYGDITLYAKWNDGNKYAVTLNADGGTVNPEQVEVKYKQAYNIPTPTRDGYSFTGWIDESSEAFPATGTWELTTDKALKATWNLDQYSITYNLNGGTNNPSNPSSYNYESDEIVLANPSKTGYAFLGWYTTSTFDEQSVITSIPNHSTGDVALYAKWNEGNQYIVTLDPNGGNVDPEEIDVQYDHAYNLPTPTRDGYSFTGWVDTNSELFPTSGTWKLTTNKGLTATWDLDQYSITYNLNGGTNDPSNPATYNYESDSINLADPSKTGYTFQGWYTTSTFDEQSVITTIANHSTGNKTLYAKWNDGNEHVVTLNPNGGNVDPTEIDVKYSYAYNLPTPTRDGYTFTGWIDENSQDFPSSGTWNIDSNKVLTATWSLNQYSITYNLNEGTNDPNNPATYTYESSTIVFADPSRTGYAFQGWYTTSTFDPESAITSIPNHSTGDVALYAEWDIVDYDISYNLAGGTNNPGNPATYTYEDEDITLLTPSKTGYTFTGWVDANSNPVTKISQHSTGNIALTATWEIIQYSIYYELNGGINGDNPTSYNYESSTIVLAEASKTGYTFQGWYTTSSFDPESAITSIPNHSTGNIALYAKWNNGNEYVVTLNPNGGNVDPTEVNVKFDSEYNLPTPTRDGYTFTGWIDEKSQGFPSSGTWNIDSNKTLTATWEIIQYSITYELNGGTNDKNNPASYTYDSSEIVFANPTKEGYTFQGWFTTSTFEEESVITSIANHSTGDKTLYAKWNDGNEYTVTLNPGEGSVDPTEVDVKYDSEYSLPIPTRTNYTFTGWIDESFVSFPSSGTWKTASNKTLNATWVYNNLTITYNLDGGTNNPANPDNFCEQSPEISLQPASKYGYAFYGWYTTSTFEEEVAVIPAHTSTNIELFAKWGNLPGLENFTYTFDNNKKITITGVIDNTVSEIVIPATILNDDITYTITAINKSALTGCNSLTSLTIPFVGGSKSSNTYFGYIFGADSANDNGTATPESLETVTILEGCTSIGDKAFYRCYNITNISIPNSVTYVGEQPFISASKLQYNIYQNQKYLGNSTNPYRVLAKQGDGSFTSVTIHPDTYVIAGSFSAYATPKTTITSLTLNNKIVSIGPYAFKGYAGLTSFVIPDNVTRLGIGVLNKCEGIVSLTTPFLGESRNPAESRRTLGYIFGAPGDSYAYAYVPDSLKTVTITEGLTTLPKFAFYSASKVETVVLPSTITSIEDVAFNTCTNLINLNIPSGVTTIGKEVFEGCSSLQSLTIPGVEYINKYSFKDCSSLKNIKFGSYTSGQQIISENAFDNCTSLEYLIIPETMFRIYNNNFNDVPAGFKVFYEGTSSTTWDNVVTKMSAEEKAKATVYYYSETEPAEAGNYWHYVDDVPTIW